MVIVYVAALAGRFSGAYDLYRWLPLDAPDFCSGQIWRVISYALLPISIGDFLANGFLIMMFGGLLERAWPKTEFWIYCVVSVLGAGLLEVILGSSSRSAISGTAPLCFGLLVGWGFALGYEKVLMMLLGEVTVRQTALVAGLLSIAGVWAALGMMNAIITAGGGFAGFCYLWVQLKWMGTRNSRIVESERMSRLEL